MICLGLVVDPKGRKASKSRGNVLDPNYLFDNFGSDAVRWYFFTSTQVGENYRTGTDTLRETVQQFFIPLWNCYSFFVTYARLDNFDPSQAQVPLNERHVLDRWLLSRLAWLVGAVGQGLEHYDAVEPARRIHRFVNDDLSNWYIRRSRRRFWKSQSDTDKAAAYQTLHQALMTVSQLLAPFAPYTADSIYRNLCGTSVHLSDWPDPPQTFDLAVETNMKLARDAVVGGLAARDSERMKVRQPLASAAIPGHPLPEEIAAIVREELNVKRLTFDAPQVQLDTTITDDLRLEGIARDIVRALQELRKKKGFEPQDRVRIRFAAPVFDQLLRAIERHTDYIQTEVLATTFEHVSQHLPLTEPDFDLIEVRGEKFPVWITRA